MSLKKKEGQYRFFYHYYKQKGKMSFHFKDEPCHVIDNVICMVPCETKWNKIQPYLVVRGWATGYKIKNNIVEIF
jgi:hypothetical protein